MPAVSKKQAKMMNIAKAVQAGKTQAQPGSPSAQVAGAMAPADVNEFAGTPQKGLPMRKAPRVVSKGVTKMPFKKK
jgi:hypothetical protein